MDDKFMRKILKRIVTVYTIFETELSCVMSSLVCFMGGNRVKAEKKNYQQINKSPPKFLYFFKTTTSYLNTLPSVF